MRVTWKQIGVLHLLLLSSCGEQSAGRNQAEIPAEIEHMMATEFPADGQVHVQSKGRFVVKPDTPVCYFPDGFSFEGRTLFTALGQPSSNQRGSGRQQPATAERCEFNFTTLLSKGVNLPNRQGRPYKLVLAVWQGDVAEGKGAYWVGGVERIAGQWHPEPQIFHPIEPPSNYRPDESKVISGSISSDISDLSNQFTASFGDYSKW